MNVSYLVLYENRETWIIGDVCTFRTDAKMLKIIVGHMIQCYLLRIKPCIILYKEDIDIELFDCLLFPIDSF